jgi:Na+/H+ antiporter NhaD/arsenite permease-like protein
MGNPSERTERAAVGVLGVVLTAVGLVWLFLVWKAGQLHDYVATCNSVIAHYGRARDAGMDAKCSAAEFVVQWRMILFIFGLFILGGGIVRLLLSVPAIRNWAQEQMKDD